MEASPFTERAWHAIRARWDPRWLNAALAVLLLLSAFLILDETRGDTLSNDEVTVFQKFGPGITVKAILAPHFGHLHLPAHLVYAAVFKVAGPDDYLILRVIGVGALLACCIAFFILVRRRVGALLALGFTAVLLFLGSSWETVLWPFSMLTFALAAAFGFGALIALDRDDRAGDVAACVLTTLAMVTHSMGIAFLVGVAVSVLLRGDRARRSWIFLVPFAIYAAWALWALQYHESLAHPSNLLLIAPFIADSLSGAAAGITGFSPDFTGSGTPGFSDAWGQVLALAAAAALAFRLLRGGVPRSLWVALAIVITFWITLTLAMDVNRSPTTSRYVFPDVALVLLVISEALAGVRLRPVVVAVVLAVLAGGVLSNVRQLQNGAEKFRTYAPQAKAVVAAVEIARNSVPPYFDVDSVPGIRDALGLDLPLRPIDDFVSIDRFGSYAFSPAELRDQPGPIRDNADRVLAGAEDLALQPISKLSRTRCTRVSEPDPFTPATRSLPPRKIELQGEQSAQVELERFGSDYPVSLADLPPGSPVQLDIPRDGSALPWRIAVTSAAPVTLCMT